MTSENKKPSTYIVQACCANCSCVFVLREYDSEPEYFCHHDSSKRPPCQSVAMDECTKDQYDKDRSLDHYKHGPGKYDIWDEWADPRSVDAWGYCLEHNLKEENDA